MTARLVKANGAILGRSAGAILSLWVGLAAPNVLWAEVGELRLVRAWTHEAGGPARAEIVAYDPQAGELLVTDSDRQRVVRLDARTGCERGFYDVAAYGAPTSAAAKRGLVAIAVPAAVKTEPGHVLLFRSAGCRGAGRAPLAALEVGALPDMLTFTPDGRKILVANEGEPSDDYTIDPPGSISIVDVGRGARAAVVRTAGFADFESRRGELEQLGVRLVAPNSAAADGRASVAQDLEPEYIAVAPDGRRAWVTLQENNALAAIDSQEARVANVVGLGWKDHRAEGNGLDLAAGGQEADPSAETLPRLYPVWGMYQPDGIGAFEADGETYLVTANEGDQREYAGFTDLSGVADLKLDESLLREGPVAGLGPLQVTSAGGDTDGDGDVDRLLAFGARSIAIWSAEGELVYDSGDALERAIAERLPHWPRDEALREQIAKRRHQKGPEPEGIAVGRVGEKTYAFVGLERTSAVAVFDVTRPRETKLVDVVPLGAGNVSPEGLAFVAADKSPLGVPLLAVACEVSGTTVLYRVCAGR